MTSISSRPFRVACARLRLLTPAVVAASAVQTSREQWTSLDEFRTLLIDRLTESMESFTLLTHLETHLETLFIDTLCQLISLFTSRLSCFPDVYIVSSHY